MHWQDRKYGKQEKTEEYTKKYFLHTFIVAEKDGRKQEEATIVLLLYCSIARNPKQQYNNKWARSERNNKTIFIA